MSTLPKSLLDAIRDLESSAYDRGWTDAVAAMLKAIPTKPAAVEAPAVVQAEAAPVDEAVADISEIPAFLDRRASAA